MKPTTKQRPAKGEVFTVPHSQETAAEPTLQTRQPRESVMMFATAAIIEDTLLREAIAGRFLA